MSGNIGTEKQRRIKTVKERRRLGAILCCLGLCCNLLLFLIKLISGSRSGSIAVTADAYNNLADALASLLSVTGFLLSSKKPSRRFPYGYGRIEYLSGLVLSSAVAVVGVRLFISSIEKFMHPQRVASSSLVVWLLLISVGVKLVMFLLYRHYAGVLTSAVMKASAADSLCDCIATLTILGSMAVYRLFSVNIDSVCGIMVAACILYAGITSSKDSALPLLGSCDEKASQKIREIARTIDPKMSVESVSFHDYGPFSKIVCIALKADSCHPRHCHRLKEAVDRELLVKSTVCLLIDEKKCENSEI